MNDIGSMEIVRFCSWAIVEVMGHGRFAGQVTDETIGGATFIRIDVPACGDCPAFTKLLAPGAIFSITPTTERIAREAVQRFRAQPLEIFNFDHQPRLPNLLRDGDDFDDED